MITDQRWPDNRENREGMFVCVCVCVCVLYTQVRGIKVNRRNETLFN